MQISVKSDTKAMTRDLNKVQRKIVPQVSVMALNRAAAAVRTSSTRQISRVKAITPQRLVRDRLRITKATRARLVATITALLLGVPAIRLGEPRRTRAGLRVKRHNLPSAFTATMPSGYFGIWERTGKPKVRPKIGRYRGTGILREPIRQVVIPLLPEARGLINAEMRTTGARTWKAEFQRLLKVRLERQAAR